jgi:SAM-dependent methyltransferase
VSLEAWRGWMALPRGAQREALKAWLAALPPADPPEAWNAAFGPGSLFDAWTRTTVALGVHTANAAWLRDRLDAVGPGFRVLEIGGGDGRLWRRVLRDDDRGTLLVVDPMDEVHRVLPEGLPEGVVVEPVVAPVEAVLDRTDLWEALDAVVCSLTLHHLAGADAKARARVGLSGPGKREVLARVAGALAPGGALLLNEADIHCDIELPPGPVLAERLMDSYVRRCAGSVLQDVALREDADDDLRARWRAIVRHWCLEQVGLAEVALPHRDVYELDVGRWLTLLDAAGLRVIEHGFTDRVALFHRYLAVPAP